MKKSGSCVVHLTVRVIAAIILAGWIAGQGPGDVSKSIAAVGLTRVQGGGFVLQDESNGNCVSIVAFGDGQEGQPGFTEEQGIYCWRKPNGTKVTGPCIITVQDGVLNAATIFPDPIVMQAGINFGGLDGRTPMGNGRLTEVRNNPTMTNTIVDLNTANSTCDCFIIRGGPTSSKPRK